MPMNKQTTPHISMKRLTYFSAYSKYRMHGGYTLQSFDSLFCPCCIGESSPKIKGTSMKSCDCSRWPPPIHAQRYPIDSRSPANGRRFPGNPSTLLHLPHTRAPSP